MVAILFITSNFIISEMQYDCYSAKYFSGNFLQIILSILLMEKETSILTMVNYGMNLDLAL